MITKKHQIRFWSKVNKTETCWLWTGKPTAQGYGYFQHYKDDTAHRVSWMIKNGDVREGFFICHKCDVRLCVNPDHLFMATHKENVLDMIRKDRRFTKISIADARAIRALHATGRFLCREIGEIFKIRGTYAAQIIRGDARAEAHEVAAKFGIEAAALSGGGKE